MRALELLDQIRSRWLDRAAVRLARGEQVREGFLSQLDQYYDLLRQALLSGDPDWLNEVLDEWVASRTQSELEQQDASLVPILNELFHTLVEVARQNLSSDEALALLNAVLPLHTHASQYVSQLETDAYVRHISEKLEVVKDNLEHLDKSKSDFISVAAHELRTPLTLIEGYTSMLEEHLSEDEKMQSKGVILLKGVSNGVNRLREIVEDMIDISLIDNDLLKLNFQPVWINQVLGALHEDLGGIAQDRSIELKIEAFPGRDEMTYADSDRLYKALWNLLTNAVKFTPDRGEITVSGRRLPGFVEITVADTGIGVPLEDQERIFEKFGNLGDVTLHSSGKTKFKGGGPGLGLPITKGIIEAHGGTIWVESPRFLNREFPGSTFHVLLPVREKSPDEKVTELLGSQAPQTTLETEVVLPEKG